MKPYIRNVHILLLQAPSQLIECATTHALFTLSIHALEGIAEEQAVKTNEIVISRAARKCAVFIP